MSDATRALKRLVRRAGRVLATGLCAALALAVVAMALAVLAQALAVLAVALLALALLLPHPLSWYAAQGGAAAGAFFHALLDSFGGFGPPSSRRRERRESDRTGAAGQGRAHGGGPESSGPAFRQEKTRRAGKSPAPDDHEGGASGSAEASETRG